MTSLRCLEHISKKIFRDVSETISDKIDVGPLETLKK